MKLWKMLLALGVAILVSSCDAPSAPVVLAPTTVPVISLPDELPKSLAGKKILWDGSVLGLQDPVGKTNSAWIADTFDFLRISPDDQYLAFEDQPIIVDQGLPKPGDEKIGVLNLQTGQKQILVSKAQSFPNAVLFAAPTFTSDRKKVVFLVSWKHADDLAEVDLKSGKIQRLNVNTLVTNYGYPDISSQGQIVVICKGPKENLVSELCLLDGNGKFIQYLTSEDDPNPGNGLFTPDGQYIVYDSRYKLYKVQANGKNRKQIAPCGILSPGLVTDTYAVVACYISQNPDCYALFVASLDGSDFRRIGYVKPVCNDQ